MEWPHPAVLVPVLLVLFALTFVRFYYVRRGLDSERERDRRAARGAVRRYGFLRRALSVLAPVTLLYTAAHVFVLPDGRAALSTFFLVTFVTFTHFLVHERYDPDAVEEALAGES